MRRNRPGRQNEKQKLVAGPSLASTSNIMASTAAAAAGGAAARRLICVALRGQADRGAGGGSQLLGMSIKATLLAAL